MDFAIGLANSVFNLPDGQVMFYEEFEQKNKTFLGLVEMTSGLVNASFSLPKWQAVKMIFLARCYIVDNTICCHNTYPLDGDLFSRKHYPTLEQPRPG